MCTRPTHLHWLYDRARYKELLESLAGHDHDRDGDDDDGDGGDSFACALVRSLAMPALKSMRPVQVVAGVAVVQKCAAIAMSEQPVLQRTITQNIQHVCIYRAYDVASRVRMIMKHQTHVRVRPKPTTDFVYIHWLYCHQNEFTWRCIWTSYKVPVY